MSKLTILPSRIIREHHGRLVSLDIGYWTLDFIPIVLYQNQGVLLFHGPQEAGRWRILFLW
jgi:hypothetical protein